MCSSDLAKGRGLATLTITDSAFSPLRGRISLYAPAESASFVAFHCAPLVLINALVHELSIADERKTVAALNRFEAVVFDPPRAEHRRDQPNPTARLRPAEHESHAHVGEQFVG